MTVRKFAVPERPADEAARRAAVEAYGLTRPQPDVELDKLVAEAAAAFGVPTAMISVAHGRRQLFPVRVGFDAPSTPRAVAFCGHAAGSDEPLVVPDATADVRFAGNPLVIAPNGIRFYAGAPLVTPEGHSIGTLCLIDRKRRAPLTTAERSRLQALARRVMGRLEARRAEASP